MRLTVRFAFAAAAVLAEDASLQAATCEDLARLSLPQTTVTMAASVASGAFSPPAGFSQNSATRRCPLSGHPRILPGGCDDAAFERFGDQD